MALIKVTYESNNDIVQEIVEQNAQRFMELIAQGVEDIAPAADDAVEGTIAKVKKIQYRETSGKKIQKIGYSTEQGKIKFIDFQEFKIKGVPIVIAENEQYGDVLAVELNNNILAIYDATEAKSIVYAIKHVQEANQELINTLLAKDDSIMRSEEEIEENDPTNKVSELDVAEVSEEQQEDNNSGATNEYGEDNGYTPIV